MTFAVKIICIYLGERRSTHASPTNIDAVKEVVMESLRLETVIRHGFKTDTIYVINGQDKSSLEFESDMHYYIHNTYDGLNASGGNIYVCSRENQGGSFGGFGHMFAKYSWKYRYWLFVEDDILITEPNYIDKAIKQLNSDDSIGFVAFSPLSLGDNPHCGGGFGMSSTKKLALLAQHCGGLLPYALGNDYGSLENAEVRFTGQFNEIGLKVVQSNAFSPLAINYMDHHGQRQYLNHPVTETWSKQNLYRIGL